MMKNKNIVPIIVLIIVLGLLSGNPFYVVNEAQQAVVTRFGEPIGNPITEAGLHIKFPFIDKVNYFEKRILEWDGYANQIPTRDKKYIWVDTTARWRIVDALKFFQAANNEQNAQSRLDDFIDSAVRDVVAIHNLIEIVRSTNRLVDESEANNKDTSFIEKGAYERIQSGRDIMRKQIIDIVKKDVPEYGIELIDMRIKRVNYVEEVRQKVYDRMIAERKRAAEEYRSEGRGEKAKVEGSTAKELKRVLSQAYKEAQQIKGAADAKAIKIYARAYNQDKEFFSFLKTLNTYGDTINEKTVLILSTEGDYFKYLNDIYPE